MSAYQSPEIPSNSPRVIIPPSSHRLGFAPSRPTVRPDPCWPYASREVIEPPGRLPPRPHPEAWSRDSPRATAGHRPERRCWTFGMAGHHEDAPPTEFSPRGISGAVRRTVCRCRYRARWDGRLPPRSRTDFGPAWAKRASRGPVRHRPITSPPRSWSRRAHRAPCRDCR